MPGKEETGCPTSPGGCKEQRRLWLYSALCVNVQRHPLCRYTLSMAYHWSGLGPSEKHSCSKFLIFTEMVRRPFNSNHQRFYPGISSFLSLLTLSEETHNCLFIGLSGCNPTFFFKAMLLCQILWCLHQKHSP